jgi:hypothetical protein
MPRGIRQDLGVETSLKLLLVACFNDRLISANASPKAVLEKLRVLTLLWYAMGANLNACLFFGYYFYLDNFKIEITYFGKNMVIPRLSEQNLDTSNIFSENWSLVSWASRLILYLQTNS